MNSTNTNTIHTLENMAANQCAMRREICKQWRLHLSQGAHFFPELCSNGQTIAVRSGKSRWANDNLNPPPTAVSLSMSP